MNADKLSSVGFQSLLTAPEIALDTETKDPNLRTQGPGCYRKDGYILGASFASDDYSVYLPIGHFDTTAEEKERHEKAILSILNRKDCIFITANGVYDLDWLQCTAAFSRSTIYTCEHIRDVQYLAALLDEYRRFFALDYLAELYGEDLKKQEKPLQYAQAHNIKYSNDVREVLWKMPQGIVADYAAYDTELTLKVYRHQMKEIKAQELERVADMEQRLIPLLLRMRKLGVRLDLKKLADVSIAVADKTDELLRDIRKYARDSKFNPKSSAHMARILDRDGIAYPRKAPSEIMRGKGKNEGNPNIDKLFLGTVAEKYPFAKQVLTWRHYNTMTTTFLLSYNKLRVGDRLHCQFNPLRANERGTVSGRYSASFPNLQQVPTASEDDIGVLSGKVMRSLFLPDEGCLFGCADYAQEEFRVLAHYALGPGAAELRAEYAANPQMDAHSRLSAKRNLPRSRAKTLNFSMMYGMGVRAYALQYHLSLEVAALLVEQYFDATPYIKPTRKRVEDVLLSRGYIRTLMGRRARKHPTRKTHSFFNRLIQGSCGDILKKALLDCWHEGIFEVLHPHLIVHDEIDVSVPDTNQGREAFGRMKYLMENAVQLKVPLLADANLGANWGEAKG